MNDTTGGQSRHNFEGIRDEFSEITGLAEDTYKMAKEKIAVLVGDMAATQPREAKEPGPSVLEGLEYHAGNIRNQLQDIREQLTRL